MLYHYASLDYLKELHRLVSLLINGKVEPLLTLSKNHRDSVLSDPRWGNRNTSENWCNNAWPFLKDLQVSLAKDIAGRAVERYGCTDTNICFRAMSEYSMNWTTPQEEEDFSHLVRIISDYAERIDQTMDDYQDSRWSDFSFAWAFREFAPAHRQIPRFRVRTDIVARSGKPPARTGVYVAQNDPHAALQFAWTGNGGGKLRPAKTFSDIGHEALKHVGRKDLWLNYQAMFDFAMHSPHQALFRPTIYMLGHEHRELAAGPVEEQAFLDRPCEWYFVEVINGEFENIEGAASDSARHRTTERLCSGEICRQTGFCFTPALADSRRRLVKGEMAPALESQYGQTIWQWEDQQDQS